MFCTFFSKSLEIVDNLHIWGRIKNSSSYIIKLETRNLKSSLIKQQKSVDSTNWTWLLLDIVERTVGKLHEE